MSKVVIPNPKKIREKLIENGIKSLEEGELFTGFKLIRKGIGSDEEFKEKMKDWETDPEFISYCENLGKSREEWDEA